MVLNPINTATIQRDMRLGGAKATGVGFGKTLEDVGLYGSALGPSIMGVAQASGSGVTANAVLGAAFSGISQIGGYQAPSLASGQMGAMSYSAQYLPTGTTAMGGGSSPVFAGTGEQFTQWDMINTMNQNNLQLLELQATLQSNMQAWNAKSNILNTDYNCRKAMIEKFTLR